MLKYFKANWKKWLFKTRSLLVAKLSKNLMHMLLKTCRIQIEGVEQFCQLAATEKCILMLWHNRLAITPFLLSRYTPRIRYTALVSGSRDGDILSMIVHSYKNGNTIRVTHQARYRALREIVRHVEEQKHILIITPDGPRGPRYEVKPGIAIAALETQAYVVSLNWEAKNYWELNTWDRLRLPKPFTTIQVRFDSPIRLDKLMSFSLEEAKEILKKNLPEI
jgi:lysophospholipid acyltransferase (LPLAT)-like uncharacterized protein